MKRVHRSCGGLLILLLMSSSLGAHPVHQHDFLSGALHPVFGPDHLLTLLLVGWWSASRGQGHWWCLPIGFVLALLAGALLGRVYPVSGLALEWSLALSVVALGALLWRSVRLSVPWGVVLVATIGVAHGFAHALELPAQTTSLQWLPGLLLGSLMIQGVGVLIGRRLRPRDRPLARWSGLVAMGAGMTLAAIAGWS